MKSYNIEYHSAASGLRMVHMHVPGCAVGYFGAAVHVGSRDEGPDQLGLAHFVEHTIFKGTARRSSMQIINRMEAVGGELNAFTTKEETVVYTAFPAGNLQRAAELVADLTCNSQFPEREIDKERDVVADEIDSYLDSPSEAVFDDFEDEMFRGSALGHNILGTRAALDTFTPEVCRAYLKRWYVPGNMVLFYAGDEAPDRVFRTLEHAFADLSGPMPVANRPVPAPVGQFDVVHNIDSHQCHTIMGCRTSGIGAPGRYELALLTNILGGPGMNSLLNVQLRERRGLVYSVEASTGLFTDCGSLAIYYGCDPDDSALCRRLVARTMASVADGYMTPRRLERAKKQYLGQLILANENLENRILAVARQTLLLGRANGADALIAGINSVTAQGLAALAASLQPLSVIELR